MIIEKHFDRELEGSYFSIPFEVPEGVERIDITYSYTRHSITVDGPATVRQEVNIIDLGVFSPDDYVGWSGSDRTHIYISSYGSAQGYAAARTVPGSWRIHVGAYKVQPEGVDVVYEIKFTMKQRRLFVGDTHMHTTGSDGVMSMEEIADLARKSRLDFIFITDHNSYIHNYSLPARDGLTVLPGSEWTHYKGHAGILGIPRAYNNSFEANSRDEALSKLREGRDNGGAVVLNHPFCPNCGWKWGMDEDVPFDLVELWNGPMCRMQLDCIDWWQRELLRGRKIRVIAGSDYHRPELLRSVGMPATCVFAPSREREDIMQAIRDGNCYLSYKPDGPVIDCEQLGQSVAVGSTIHVSFSGLSSGDRIRVIYNEKITDIDCKSGVNRYHYQTVLASKGFVRFEVLRAYLAPGVVEIASISNAVFID